MSAMRVMVVDDHALLREGVGLLLRRLDSAVEIVEAGTLAATLEELKSAGRIDLMLLDLALPDGSGIDSIASIHRLRPGLPVVVLSAADDRATVMRALDAGALGYVPKSSSADTMLDGLRVVLNHGVYLPPDMLDDPAAAATDDGSGTNPALDLTPRQMEVLRLILCGMPIKSIARELDISTSTAKAHTSVILRALNVTTRTQVVVEAGRRGLAFGPGLDRPGERPDA